MAEAEQFQIKLNSQPFKRKITLIKNKIMAIQKILTQESFSNKQICREICEVFSDVAGIRMSKHKYDNKDNKGLIAKLIKKALKKDHGLDQLIFDLQAKQQKLKKQFNSFQSSQSSQQQDIQKNLTKQQKQSKPYLKLQETLQLGQKNQKTLQQLRTTIRQVQILKKIKAKKQAIHIHENTLSEDRIKQRFNSTIKSYLQREMLSNVIFRHDNKLKF